MNDDEDALETALAAAASEDASHSSVGQRPDYPKNRVSFDLHKQLMGGLSVGRSGTRVVRLSPAKSTSAIGLSPPVAQAPTITLADLGNHPIWVGWRHETSNGRSTKTPYDPRTRQRAEADNAATWATRAEAERWAATHRGDGVGVMLGQVADNAFLCGIDFDSCRDPDIGTIAPWAQEVLDRFKTYTEISPSGTGVKAFFKVANVDLAAVETLFENKYGRSFKNGGNGGHPPAIEIHRGRRYFTVTGESCGPTLGLRNDATFQRDVNSGFFNMGNGRGALPDTSCVIDAVGVREADRQGERPQAAEGRSDSLQGIARGCR